MGDTLLTDHMPTDHMLMAHGDMVRDLLMLSQRLMLSMESTDTVLTDHMPMVPTDHMLTPPDGDMARDLLMLKPRLTPLSTPLPTLSLLSHMLVSTLSTPQLSTQLDPQSTMERERPRLIQLSSTATLSQLSTLLSAPHLSTTPMPSQLSPRLLSPTSPLPRLSTTVLSELMPDSSTPPTPESASTTLESRSHAKCANNLETDVQ